MGKPHISRVSTSHVEKQNHTLRMHCRRLSRLTNAFGEKLENFKAAIGLNLAYYNLRKNSRDYPMHSGCSRCGRIEHLEGV